MKYVKQFLVILLFSFLGEVLNRLIPLPIPAGIYGLVLLFLALQFRIVRPEQVAETGHFLVEIMPVMFIPAAAGLLESWGLIRDHLAAYAVMTVVTTVLVMGISGRVTQVLIRKKGGKDHA